MEFILNVNLSSYSGASLFPWKVPRNLFACLIAMTSQQDIHGQWQLQAKIDHDPHSTWNIARSNLVTGHPQQLSLATSEVWKPWQSHHLRLQIPIPKKSAQGKACVGSANNHHEYQQHSTTSIWKNITNIIRNLSHHTAINGPSTSKLRSNQGTACAMCGCKKTWVRLFLGGGWTNPSEKY